MQLELTSYDHVLIYKELQEMVFLATHHKFDLVGVPLGVVSKTISLVDTTKVATVIDLPFGNSPTSLRLHGIIDAARKQIKIIDLVVNHTLIANDCWKEFKEDIAACVTSCNANKLDLRCIVDYRLLEPSVVLEICKFLKKMGVSTIITSTGLIVDEPVDNIIISKQISKLGLNVIVSSNAFTPATFQKLQILDPYGVRFTSTNLVRSIFGQY